MEGLPFFLTTIVKVCLINQLFRAMMKEDGSDIAMMYPFLTLDDNTEIVHSEMLSDGRVKVYVEKPDAKDGFHSAICYLPGYDWQDVFGFSQEDIARYQAIIEARSEEVIEKWQSFFGEVRHYC